MNKNDIRIITLTIFLILEVRLLLNGVIMPLQKQSFLFTGRRISSVNHIRSHLVKITS